MASSHFEREVEKAMVAIGTALLKVDAANVAEVARLQGRAYGLEQSLGLYRKAARTDLMAEDGL